MSKSFANIRKDYLKFTLDEKQIHPDPFQQFQKWFEEAQKSGIEEVNAMALATVSDQGFPSSRMVLLKEVNPLGFVFFTNYESRKGKHLAKNPNAAILFFWKEMERQIRIEGNVRKIDAAESDIYFESRPIESRISAIISPQSQKIDQRESIEELRKDFIQSNSPAKRPEHWGGYVLIPEYFEFWQGRECRLHDRMVYCRNLEKGWKIKRLAP